MKLVWVRLENYIGIFNGSGGNSIFELDLSGSNSNIIIIRGSNGSGKSTLLKSLSPLQDDNTAIIPGLEGKKILRYIYNGELYEIVYIHPVKNDGSRGQVKMQVYKGPNRVELNPTWNVTSGRDIIFELFNLDSNFLTLSQLSSEDRGLADKKPAERKKFVNSIISGIEAYNSMYKTITKKYSNAKSMINTISSKINQIGNIEELNSRYVNITKQVEDVSKERDRAIMATSKIDSEIAILTRDNNLDEYYKMDKEITDNIKEIDRLFDEISNISVGELSQKTFDEILNNISIKLEDNKTRSIVVQQDLANIKSKLKNLEDDKIVVFEELQSKITKRSSIIDANFSDNDLVIYNESKAKIDEINQEIINMNTSIKNLSDAESLINALDMIVPVIDSIYNGLDQTTKEDKNNFVRETLDLGGKYIDRTVELGQLQSEITRDIHELEGELIAYEILFDKAKSLALRPKNCKIDECAFVKDAIDAANKNPESRMDDINKQLVDAKSTLKSIESEIEFYSEVYDFYNRFNNLYSMILSFKKLFDKSPIAYLCDQYALLDSLTNLGKIREDFNIIRGIFNIMTTKDKYEEIVESLKEPASKYEANKALVDELDSDITSLKSKLESIDKDISSSRVTSAELTLEDSIIDKKIEVYTECKSKANDGLILVQRNQTISEEINKLSDVAMKVKELEAQLLEATNRAERLNNDLNHILSERDIITSNKTLLEDYLRDLELYNKNFSILETVRYYLSPTTGIQTIFMRTYMGNIILKANELLSLIFNGQFIIQPFVINEAEFRIPCLGNGLINDDISSMSTSQICMISMILSFAILSNSSTEYNILKLDEIDGGLDTENRIQFIGLLKQLIYMVGCEQCFLISHNMEYDVDTTVIDMNTRQVTVR